MPARFIKEANLDDETVDEYVKYFLQYLNDNKMRAKNGKIHESFLISISPDLLTNNKFEKLLFNNCKVKPRFNRVIYLEKDKSLIKSKYSKTVIKSVSERSLNLHVIDKNSSKELIDKEFQNLRRLHLLSAGKLTRSEKSWQMQLEMVSIGNGFLISGYKNGIIQTSAFFMTNLNSAYYGVSASTLNRLGESFSHQLIDFAIDYLCKNDFNSLWLGEQYSYLSDPITLREKNIELFKSFFGGELVLDLILNFTT
jgi:hypothetical protein